MPDIYSLVFVLEGEALYEDRRGTTSTLTAGSLLFLFPGLSYRYVLDEDRPWSEFYFLMTGRVFDLWCEAEVLRQDQPVWELESVHYWTRRFEEVYERISGSRRRSSLEGVMALLMLLAEAKDSGANQPCSAEEKRFLEEARSTIDAHPLTVFSPDWPQLCRPFYLSYSRFRRKFSALAGETPTEYLFRRRMDEALGMVLRGVPQKDIARSLGYSDVYYFNRSFTKNFGISPGLYRKHHGH